MSSFEAIPKRSHRGRGQVGFQGLPRSVAGYARTVGKAANLSGSGRYPGRRGRVADAGLCVDLGDVQGAEPQRTSAHRQHGRNTLSNLYPPVPGDLAFWTDVASHPQVQHVLSGMDPSCIEGLLNAPNIPMAFEHGGFIFVPADSFKRVYELHTLFKPEGWGKPVFHAARQAFDRMFEVCDLIVTHETRHPQSKPPKTFRFQPLGEFTWTPFGEARLWMLSREAWMNSPARKH